MTPARAKRIFDCAAAVILSAVLAPVAVVVALVVRVGLGRPVIFKQTRVGLGDRLFTIYKFRTMSDSLDAHGEPLPDEARLSSVGRFVRTTSLDELPELYNVLRGDMSLVGPRPLLPEYLPLYSPQQRRRHEVRPGLTGLAQIEGRNSLEWDVKLALDVAYVDSRNLLSDIRILGRTLVYVGRRQGINMDGHATSPMFTGNEHAHGGS